jgi:hypothetical protein
MHDSKPLLDEVETVDGDRRQGGLRDQL